MTTPSDDDIVAHAAGRSLRGSQWLMPALIIAIFLVIAVSTYRKVRPDLAAKAAAAREKEKAK